jgi:hypothetical protein
MRKKLLGLLLMVSFVLMRVPSIAQGVLCTTPQIDIHKKELGAQKNLQSSVNNLNALAVVQPNPTINVKVVFHIYNNCITSANSDVAISQLNAAYNPHKINFSKLCDDFVPLGGAEIDLPYAINIYVYGFFVQPHAKAVGSNAYYLSSSGTFNSTLIHEMGHCLYLFHTHNEVGCPEKPDGSNCVTCGDYVCDTPADPTLYTNQYWVGPACQYTGNFVLEGQTYNPDTHNFMSYSRDDCRNRFTIGQGQRMYNALKSLSVLIPTTKPAEIQGQTSVCTSSTFSFTVLPTASVSWSTNTSGLSITASGLATRVNNYNGYATITATISGNTCGAPSAINKNILVGKPLADNSTLIWTSIRGVNPVTLNAGSINNYQVDNVPSGFTSYGGSTTTSGPYISLITGNQQGTFNLYCSANNSCGSSYTNNLAINVVGSGGGGGIQLRSPSPNPAANSINIKLKNESTPLDISISLFNSNMEQVFMTKTSEMSIDIPVNHLSEGNYYLNILDGKELTKKQVIIKH